MHLPTSNCTFFAGLPEMSAGADPTNEGTCLRCLISDEGEKFLKGKRVKCF